ncbi:MAG: GGDEF domain-containing protein [Proteobacteria bacterium]|nr:GGDEF domain-containing protein [Pseudomonadota bacterium]
MNIKNKLFYSTLFSLLLIIGALGAGLLGYRSITTRAATISALEGQLSSLQMLFRGINESILTDGTPYSIELVMQGITKFEYTHRLLLDSNGPEALQRTLREEISPKWKEMRATTEKFTVLNGINPDDNEAMIEYGAILFLGEEVETSLRTVIKRLEVDNEHYLRNTQYALAISIPALLLLALYLQLDLYRTIARPIRRLRELIEDVELKHGEAESSLSTKSETIKREFLGPSNTNGTQVSDIRTLAHAFNAMVERVVHHIQERSAAEQALEKLAVTDNLTQVYNRVKLDDIIKEASERSRVHNSLLSVIILDLDNFKEINDTYGHLAGDTVLKEVAGVVRKNVRSTDHLVRWGGEEFLIVSPGTGLAEADELANKLRRLIEGHDFGRVGAVTASFGLTQFREGDTEDSFLTRADGALYKAKDEGRNRVEACA